MHTHEDGDVLALQAETEVEHQALIRLCNILSSPWLRYPAPRWHLPRGTVSTPRATATHCFSRTEVPGEFRLDDTREETDA